MIYGDMPPRPGRRPSAFRGARAGTRRPKIGLGLVLALVAVVPLRAAPDKEEQPMALAKMPVAVQRTIRENLRGGALVKAERERRADAVIYEAVVARGAGERFALEIAPDGRLIEIVRGTASSAE